MVYLSPTLRRPAQLLRGVWQGLDDLGALVLFCLRTVGHTGRAVSRYRDEVWRVLSDVSLGSGALSVVGGTVGIITFMTFSTGTVVGLAGYQGLHEVGTEVYTGFISAYFNTREIAPLVAALALSATVGCGFTAQLGAMRISEEIDALEVMAIPSLPYLVSTRLVAASIAVIPLYAFALVCSYAATRFVAVTYYHQSAGTYDHYFHVFLPQQDIVYSIVKVLVFAVIVVLLQCYYGYKATGGPAGVGVAVGRSVRAVIVLVTLVDFFLSLAFWGATSTVRIAG